MLHKRRETQGIVPWLLNAKTAQNFEPKKVIFADIGFASAWGFSRLKLALYHGMLLRIWAMDFELRSQLLSGIVAYYTAL